MFATTHLNHHGSGGALTLSCFPTMKPTATRSVEPLPTAPSNFLGDVALVEQLLNTKSTATATHCKLRLLHRQTSLSRPPPARILSMSRSVNLILLH